MTFDLDTMKKWGEALAGWFTVGGVAIGGAFKVFPTRGDLKKVNDDLQAHKADDKEKHDEFKAFVETQIAGIRETVEKPFDVMVKMSSDIGAIKAKMKIKDTENGNENPNTNPH